MADLDWAQCQAVESIPRVWTFRNSRTLGLLRPVAAAAVIKRLLEEVKGGCLRSDHREFSTRQPMCPPAGRAYPNFACTVRMD